VSERSQNNRLTNRDEQLFRQVNPNFIHGGRVSSQAFRSKKQLSVDRENRTTAEQSYRRFIDNGLRSAGTWAVTVGEAENVLVHAYESPLETNSAHTDLDFEPLTNKERRRASVELARMANERGVRYQAVAEE